jgi:hypothetical protein
LDAPRYIAWLARQPEVLRAFSKLVWLTAGADESAESTERLLRLAYLQARSSLPPAPQRPSGALVAPLFAYGHHA